MHRKSPKYRFRTMIWRLFSIIIHLLAIKSPIPSLSRKFWRLVSKNRIKNSQKSPNDRLRKYILRLRNHASYIMCSAPCINSKVTSPYHSFHHTFLFSIIRLTMSSIFSILSRSSSHVHIRFLYCLNPSFR